MATSTTTVHVRVKQTLKRKAEKALQAMGLSVSDAVRILLTRVAAEQKFPLKLEVPNARTRAAMRELEHGAESVTRTLRNCSRTWRSDGALGGPQHGLRARRETGTTPWEGHEQAEGSGALA